MHSPLPDSSALEAGIIEDDRPTRLSRVQDNVRNLLRNSVFGSVKSSPTTPTRMIHGLPTPEPSPVRFHPRQPEVLPSPSSESSRSTTRATPASINVAHFPQPPESYNGRFQRMAHRSAMFNSRAVDALNHPDLSDPSMEDLSQQKSKHRQRKGWKRSRRSRRAAQRAAASRGVLVVLASVLLAALVATYVSIATTSGLTTTFHVLFVLGICLATILLAHSAISMFLRSRNRPHFVPVARHAHQLRPRHRRHPHEPRPQRQMPTLSVEPIAFVPPTPIPVHLSTDDVREDPRVAEPSAGTQVAAQDWDKEVVDLPNPPPAYGRWRGSVRANPDLLHWQAIPSPVSPETPVLPSPTYEEAMADAQNESPPSYVTRDIPARQREIREARAGIAPQSPAIEPEMVEVRAVGVGLAM